LFVMSVWHGFWADPQKLKSFQMDAAVLRRAWRFAAGYRWLLLLYLAVTAVAGLVQILPAFVIQRIIDQALPGRDPRQLALLSLSLGGLYIVNTGLMITGRWIGLRIGSGIILTLRAALYDRIQRLPLAFFTRAQTGLIQSRLNNDVGQVNGLLTDTVSSAVTDVLSLAFTLVAMFALSWQVSVAVLAIVPPVLLTAEVVGRRARLLHRDMMKRWGAMNVATAERFNVAGALLVKLFGKPENELERFQERIQRIRDTSVRSELLLVSFGGVLGLAGSLALVAIYWIGGLAVLGGSLTLGTVIALATLAQRVYGPVVDLATVRVNMTQGLVGFERVVEVLDTPLAIVDRPGARELLRPRGEVRFEGVRFRYPAASTYSIASLEGGAEGEGVSELATEPSDWILRDLSFESAPGSMTALVGPTGAGKTTICLLVPRLYDATEGAVRVDGHDVRDLTLSSLSASVGMVPQDTHLFHDTIAANLRYARPGASEAEVVAACRAARIHDLISSLPDGYETLVGERGYRMSGGEKQRLAIARVLLKNPAVLILDEATSHLDSETEALVQQALHEAMRDRTSFVIAHRLSTVRAADQILVLDSGRLVERGTHKELLRGGGLYSELYGTQFAVARS
jgi:ATP-binding cassette subfamily B protein